MRSSRAVLGWMTVALLAASAAGAQGLGDAAKREKARRAEAKPAEPAKVYTDDSVRGEPSHGTYSAPGGTSAPAPDASGSAASRDARTPAAPPPSGSGEAYWRDRATAARAAVERAEKAVRDAEAKETAMGPTIPGQTAAPCAQGAAPGRPGESVTGLRDRGKTTVTCDAETLHILDGQKAHAETEAAHARLAAARKAVDDLEDEARKAGALPGWLR